MTERRPRDLVNTLGLLFEAASYLKHNVAVHIESTDGMEPQWFETLMRLARSPGRTSRISDMAVKMDVPLSSFSRLVDRLEAAGLLERYPDPTNRRAVLIRATTAGEARLDRAAVSYLESAHRYVVDHIDDDDLDMLERVTRRLRDANLPLA